MNKERLRKYFIDLLQVYSPFTQERAAANVIVQILKGINVPYYEDKSAIVTGCNCGNIIVAGSSRARISFCAHMDTIRIYEKRDILVAGELFRAKDGGVLGIDDKSGVAILLEVITCMQESSGVPDDIHFIFTTCEEDGFLGAKSVEERHFKDAFNFVVDSGGVPIGYTVNKGAGQYDFKIQIKGKMSHASTRGSLNSLVLAAKLITILETGPVSAQTYINVNRVTSQGNPNTLPDFTEFIGEVLSFDTAEATRFLGQIAKQVEVFAQEHSCMVVFSYHCACEPFIIEEKSQIVEYARGAANRAQLEFRLGSTGSGSDAHVFNQRGAQALKISSGMLNVHSKEEQINLQDMVKCVSYVLALAAAGSSA